MTAGFVLAAEHHPEVFAAYSAYVDEVWGSDALPPGTLELCRIRIARLLGAVDEEAIRLGPAVAGLEDKLGALGSYPEDARFTAADRACLAFAEQFLLDTQALDDPTADAVRAEVGDAGLVTLALGVGLAEAMVRAAVMLGDRPDPTRFSSVVERGRDGG